MLSEKLGLSISKKLFNKTSTKRTSPTVKKLSKTSLNFMALPRIARDLNIIRQNIVKLIKVYGGDASEKEDMHVLKDDERERKFKVLQDKFIEQNTKSEDDEKSSKGKLFKKFKEIAKNQIKKLKENLLKLFEKLKKFAKELFGKIKDFAKNAFKYIEEAFEKYLRPTIEKLKKKVLKKAVKTAGATATRAVVRGLAAAAGPIGWIALIILTLWDGLTDAWETWQSTGSLYETIKAGIAGLVDSLTFGLFDKDTAKKVIDGTVDFIKNFPEKLSNFINDTSDHIFTFVNNAIDKMMEMNPLKEKPLSEKELGAIIDQQKAAAEAAKAEEERQKRVAENLQKAREIILMKTEERDRLIDEVAVLEEQATGKPSETTKKIQQKREELRTSEKSLADAIQREQQAKKEAYAPKPAAPGGIPPSAPTKVSGRDALVKTIVSELQNAGITNRFAIIATLANIQKETGFKKFEEDILAYKNTSNDRIRQVFTTRVKNYSDAQLHEIKKDPYKFAEVIYGMNTSIGKSMGNIAEGDGFKYIGRGFIQLTGKNNYALYGKLIGEDLIGNPTRLLDPVVAAKVTAQFILKGVGSKVNSFSSQSEANRAITQAIGGKSLNLNQGIGAEILAKVDKYSSEFSGMDLSSTSKEVSQGQREQLKPTSANVVDVSQTNNTKGYDTKTTAITKSNANESMTARVT
jgi:predicted chitinase